MKILTYITNYEGNKKINYVKEIITSLEGIECEKHDVIIYTTDDININSNKLNIIISKHPKVFSNSKYSNNWQKEPEFIWLHRKDLMNKVNQYDYYIHLEDDVLLTKENFKYFIIENKKIPENKIIGFLITENEKIVSMSKHNDNIFFRNNGNYITPNNLHSASWLLENKNLKYCISKGLNSKPKLVSKYNIKCTACTEFYIFLEKLIPKKQIEKYTLKHLTNKYIKKYNLLTINELKSKL